MDDITTNTARPTARPTRFMLRWVACTLLVAGVFLASRLTNDTNDPAQSADTTATTRPSTADPATTTASPEEDLNSGVGSGDVFAAFDGLVEDLFGPPRPDDASADDGNASPGYADWATTSGDGATGGTWSMTYPTEWQLDDTTPGVTMFSAPDYPSVATVITRPYTGPMDPEVARDLDQIMQGMPDGTLVSLETVDFDGRDATRAGLGYTNPAGQLAAVNVIWIRDGSTLYLLAGEAGVDRPELQATVDRALNSFTITEPA